MPKMKKTRRAMFKAALAGTSSTATSIRQNQSIRTNKSQRKWSKMRIKGENAEREKSYCNK